MELVFLTAVGVGGATVIGALIGSAVMKKISERILHYMFSLLLIYSGLRLIFR